MQERIRGHIRSNVVGYVALFFSLGLGTAWANHETIFSDDIVDEEVKAADIDNSAVRTFEIRDDTVQGLDILDATIASADIQNGQVRTGDLADEAVTQAKLQPPAAVTDAGLPNAFGGCPAGENAWEDFSPDVNNAVGYYRDPLGRVHLQGVAVKCGEPPSSLRIFTLPLGYRPGKREHHAAVYSTGVKELWIDPNGEVIAINGQTPGNWVSLDGVTFRCTPPGSNGCP